VTNWFRELLMIIGRAGRRTFQKLKIRLIEPTTDTTPPVSQAPADTTPDAFTFTDVSGVLFGTTQTSNTITVSGLGEGVTVLAVLSGDASSELRLNGGAWQSTSASVQNGDTIAVRNTASPLTSTTLTIGGVSDTFTSSTLGSASGQAVGLLLAITRAA
jgi:hypothetical protein